MDDKLWNRQVIHFLELVINHNQSTHELDSIILNDIVSLWTNIYDKFINPYALERTRKYVVCDEEGGSIISLSIIDLFTCELH